MNSPNRQTAGNTTSAPANARRNAAESTLESDPAGGPGPESGGAAGGTATIGAHGPGSGHAHGGGLINVAASGATSAAAGRQAIVLVLVATLLFAAYDALSKYLLPCYPVAQLLWARNALHVLLMAMFFGRGMGWGLLRSRRPLLQIFRALMLVSVSFLVMFGLRRIPLAETTAIIFLSPLLITALSAPLLREKVGRSQWAAVALGFVGVLLIVRPGAAVFEPAILFPLLGAVCYSLYQILTRKFSGAENPVTTHFYTGLVGLAVASAGWQGDWAMPDWRTACLIAGLGLSAGIGHYLLIMAFQRVGPAAAAPFSYTQLAWVMLFGYLFFGEIPDVVSLTGILVIVGSGLFVALRSFWRRQAPKLRER